MVCNSSITMFQVKSLASHAEFCHDLQSCARVFTLSQKPQLSKNEHNLVSSFRHNLFSFELSFRHCKLLRSVIKISLNLFRPHQISCTFICFQPFLRSPARAFVELLSKLTSFMKPFPNHHRTSTSSEINYCQSTGTESHATEVRSKSLAQPKGSSCEVQI